MAAEGDVDLDLEAEENCTGKPAEKPRKHDSGAADLERVTDYAEEKEISSSDLETVRAPGLTVALAGETCGRRGDTVGTSPRTPAGPGSV